MFDQLTRLADGSFLPHGHCYHWEPGLLWLHVVSDALIALSYFAIPAALLYFVWRRPHLPFRWMFLLFAAFVAACGTTHVMAIWTVWRPDYLTEGVLKAVTAVISVVAATLLVPLLPRALALRNASELSALNHALKREVAERRRTEVWLRELLEAAPDGIVVVDAHGMVELVNPQTERMFGYAKGELLGHDVEILVPERLRLERDEEGRRRSYFNCPSTRDATRGFELRGLRKDGTEFPVEISLSPLTSEDRVCVMAAIRDVSERKLAEDKLFQAQKMEAVGQLTGGVAHDFNNLLTVVSGNLQILRDRVQEDPRGSKLVAAASKAVERGSELTQKLLAFSRRQALQPREIQLNLLLDGITDWLRRAVGEHIEIETRQAADLWTTLADPQQVETALLNLVLNARDAMPNGGKLTIETGNAPLDDPRVARLAEVSEGSYVVLSVTDTGCGMSEAVARRAVEPFFTTKELNKGSGLGLSMVYGFAEQSGGHLKIYSEEGRGTTIKVFLPRAAGDPAASDLEAPPAEAVPMGDETVLVVEDDAGVREVAGELLAELGYRVRLATDGPSALAELARGEPVDLLFTDLVMPGGMSGTELAREAQRLYPHLRILFASGYTHHGAMLGDRLTAEDHLLTKPYRKEDLATKVRGLLDRAPEVAGDLA